MKKCEYWKKTWNSPPFLNVPDRNGMLHHSGLSCLNPGWNPGFTFLRYPLYRGCQKSCGTCKEKRETKGRKQILSMLMWKHFSETRYSICNILFLLL